MTAEEPSVTSADELNAELHALLRRAHDSGVEVRGGWTCPHDGGHPDWDVVVTGVERRERSD